MYKRIIDTLGGDKGSIVQTGSANGESHRPVPKIGLTRFGSEGAQVSKGTAPCVSLPGEYWHYYS